MSADPVFALGAVDETKHRMTQADGSLHLQGKPT